MRRKTFDVLFSTRDGMEMLVKEKCLWRSLWYFTMSVGLFCGVITNQLFLEQPLSVRFGIIAVVLVITGVCLLMYGFLLHGILCTMGALIGTFWHYCRCTGYNGRMPFNVRLFAARYFVYYGRAGRRCRWADLPFGLHNAAVFNADAGSAVKHEIVIYRHFSAGSGNSGRAAVDGISFGAFFAVGIPY